MRINSECLNGTAIPIDGVTFRTQQELNNFINRIHKNYPNLTSEQWRAVLFIAFNGLAIGFTDGEKDRPKGLTSYVKRPSGTLEEQLQSLQDKALKDARKDSE